VTKRKQVVKETRCIGKSTLRLPDLEVATSAVLNSLFLPGRSVRLEERRFWASWCFRRMYS
jgi:hypothetical protein